MDRRAGSGHPQFPHGTPKPGETTGRYVVIFREDDVESGARLLDRNFGARLLSTKGSEKVSSNVMVENVLFSELGAAVVSLKPDEFFKLKTMKDAQGSIVAIEPERYVYPLQGPRSSRASASGTSLSSEYLRGYRDASANVLNQFIGVRDGELFPEQDETTVLVWDEPRVTWGLQATGVDRSACKGHGARLAILDTGYRPHPDFNGRDILSRSFIEGEEVEDRHGHGTHCAGTAAGPKEPGSGPRYGVAFEAELLVGKVLSNEGHGTDGAVLAGLNWALEQGTHIISMSLGSSVLPGQTYSTVYEEIALRALKQDCLIIAAAGNEFGQPVGSPANCPSIISVGAIDEQLRPAVFSSQGQNRNGGEINIVAPGVNVHSAWSPPSLYRRLNGTSMATPHVAGIAALWLEKTGAKGLALWRQLENSARALPQSRELTGAGLVQAP